MIIELFKKIYIAYPVAYERSGSRIRFRAWSLADAKMKAQQFFNEPDQINIVAYEEKNIHQ